MWSGVSVVTPAASLPVTVAEVKARTKIDTADDDADLTKIIAEVVALLENANGIALMQQAWRLKRNFSISPVDLPGWPVKSVTSVKYLDADEVEQTASTSLYRVITDISPAKIALRKGLSWPTVGPFEGAFYVDYVVGEADAANIKEDIIERVLLLVTKRYEDREYVFTDHDLIMVNHRQAWAAA